MFQDWCEKAFAGKRLSYIKGGRKARNHWFLT